MNQKRFPKRWIGIGWMALAVFALSMNVFQGPKEARGQSWKPKGLVVVGDSETTSTAYASGMAMLKTITEKTGVQFRMIGDAKTSGRAAMLKDRVVSVLWMPTRQAVIALSGKFEYEKWGPQSIRCVWNGGELPQGLAVRANSGIKTLADLKGKRVPKFPGDPSADLFYIEAPLAFANLAMH